VIRDLIYNEDLKSRFLGVGLGILSIVSYSLNWLPESFRNQASALGGVLAIGFVLKPQLMVFPNKLVEKKYCQPCSKIQQLNTRHDEEIQKIKGSIPAKNFRFTNFEKVVTVDHRGNGWLNNSFELLNDGQNSVRTFPFEFSSTTAKIKPLDQLAADNEFNVESNDSHSIKWEKVVDEDHRKKVNLIFDQAVEPGETRKYSVRYRLIEAYKVASLPGKNSDWASWTPIHLVNKMKIKIVFLPNYPFSNPRCHVTSPGGDPMNTKCHPIENKKDASGGRYIELIENYPWMYHNYRLEWDIPSQ
jgi:hypothetical protein